MANQKITDYPVGTGLKDTDLVDVSVDNGDTTFTTKSFTIAQLKAIAENLGNANLTQSAANRQYDIVATQLLEFINGNFKVTKSATNYVYWEDGILLVRGIADATSIFEVLDSANRRLLNVGQISTEVRNKLDLYDVAADNPDFSLGIKGNRVVKSSTGRILYKVKPEQSGTAAPVFTTYIDDTGETITTSRTGVGTYLVSGFNGLLTGNVEIKYEGNQIDAGNTVKLFTASTTGDNFVIETYDGTNTLADSVLNEDTVGVTHFGTITITKY